MSRATAVVYAETRLNAWAGWAKQYSNHQGYPKISLIYKVMRRKARRLGRIEEHRSSERPTGLLTAQGKETLSFRPPEIGKVPEPIAEVDFVVARLPPDLHEVVMTEYFDDGVRIEDRANATRWGRARYSQLLECAKYVVYASLDTHFHPSLEDYEPKFASRTEVH